MNFIPEADTIYQGPISINIGGSLVDFSSPKVLGIINVTPDSFYAGSRLSKTAAEAALSMLEQGADFIDIGGCSTRPGASAPSADDEFDRLAPALENIRLRLPDAIISVDTFRASVARRCVLRFGVNIINDIGGGNLDPDMPATVAELGVPYILVHSRANPHDMQSFTEYDDITADIIRELAFKIESLHQLGIHDIIIDPGFGFAKTVDQNFRLLNDLHLFRELGSPVLAGMSRKSMLCKSLDISAEECKEPTVAADMVALMNGADILRVHDVLPAVQSCKIFNRLKMAGKSAPFNISRFKTVNIPAQS